jgi:hypothetical protein
MVLNVIRYTLYDLKYRAGERRIDSARNEALHRAKGGEEYPTYKIIEEG